MLPTHDEKLLLLPGEEMAVLGIRSAGVWWCAVVWGGGEQFKISAPLICFHCATLPQVVEL